MIMIPHTYMYFAWICPPPIWIWPFDVIIIRIILVPTSNYWTETGFSGKSMSIFRWEIKYRESSLNQKSINTLSDILGLKAIRLCSDCFSHDLNTLINCEWLVEWEHDLIPISVGRLCPIKKSSSNHVCCFGWIQKWKPRWEFYFVQKFSIMIVTIDWNSWFKITRFTTNVFFPPQNTVRMGNLQHKHTYIP